MSGCGSLVCFGQQSRHAASIAAIDSSIFDRHPSVRDRESGKCILPPVNSSSLKSVKAPCAAISRLCNASLVLLEDGQVHDLDRFESWDAWVADAFTHLNGMRLPITQLSVGGSELSQRQGTTPRSASIHGSSPPFFICCTRDGEVYAFGDNSFGQLGLGHTREVRVPTRVPKFAAPPATPVSARQSTYEETKSNDEVPTAANIKLASKSPLPVRIVSVSTGRAHSLFLTDTGVVYACGRNMEGACGLSMSDSGRAPSPSNLALYVTPRAIPHLSTERIVGIGASQNVSVAWSKDGRVWNWGYGLMKKQLCVPTPVTFPQENDGVVGEPRIIKVAVGHNHALLLSQLGTVYSLGLNTTGALGLGSDVASTARVESARRISIPELVDDETTVIVDIEAGSFNSALIDSRGRIFTCGSGDGGKIGHLHDDEESVVKPLHIDTPTMVTAPSVQSKTAAQVYLGPKRMLVFIPTMLHLSTPRVLQAQGGTHLALAGAGFAIRDMEAQDVDGDTADGESNSRQIVVSFTYLGVTSRVAGLYDPIEDVIRVRSPLLRHPSSTSSHPIPAPGGVYRDGTLENCVVRVSMDGGDHFSNALALHVFKAFNESNPTKATSRDKHATPAQCELVPQWGPMQGGTTLQINAPFDIIPYQRILVRFRLAGVGDDEQQLATSVDGPVIGVVEGEFDPLKRCVRCITPPINPSLIPPSSTPPAPSSPPSRFIRPVPPLPRASLVSVWVELALDGENFVTFNYPGQRFQMYNIHVRAGGCKPNRIGLAGSDHLEIACSGVHFTNDLGLRFQVQDGFETMTVPARFVSLDEYRVQQRAQRDTRARAARKVIRDELDQERRKLAKIAAEECEEQQSMLNKDPKERERMLKEAERLAKEKAKAEKATSAESSNLSTPVSSEMSPDARSGRRRSPSASKSSSSASMQQRPATPQVVANVQKDDAARAAADAAAEAEARAEAEAAAEHAAREETDEWAQLEARIQEEEAAEDKSLAHLSPIDRAAIGFICCRTPCFTSFGSCAPTLSLSLNGNRDFTPLKGAHLQVCHPRPTKLVPNCGPMTGGTRVHIAGEFFYYDQDIQVKLNPVEPPTKQPQQTAADQPVPSSDEEKSVGGGGKSKSSSQTASAATTSRSGKGGRRKSDAGAQDATAASLPIAPLSLPQAQVVPAEYLPSADGTASALEFTTPSFAAAVSSGSARSVATTASGMVGGGGGSSSSSHALHSTVHVAFSPADHAFTPAEAALPFIFYDTPSITEAHPLTLNPMGGTEVTLSGRGLIDSSCVKVRLVLPDVEVDSKGRPIAMRSTGTDGGDAPLSARSRAARLAAAAQSGQSGEEAVLEAARQSARRRAFPTIDVDATWHSNEMTEDEEAANAAAATAKAKGRRAGTRQSNKNELEAEAPTITFVTPPATVFNPDFADGSSFNRAVEVELALNGQQFVPTGIVLRFEKDAGAKRKTDLTKKK